MAKLGTPENPEIIEPGQRPRGRTSDATTPAGVAVRVRTLFNLLGLMVILTGPALILDSGVLWLIRTGWSDESALAWILALLVSPLALLATLLALVAVPLLLVAFVLVLAGRPINMQVGRFGLNPQRR